jgi:hypothetical protein
VYALRAGGSSFIIKLFAKRLSLLVHRVPEHTGNWQCGVLVSNAVPTPSDSLTKRVDQITVRSVTEESTASPTTPVLAQRTYGRKNTTLGDANV